MTVAIGPELASAALLLARLGGLCTTAPVLGDEDVPRRARLGLALALTAALAPLRPAPAFDEPGQLLTPLLWELALGLATGAAARLALAAVEVAGQLISISLGLGFASQYDPRLGESADAVRSLARTLAALAFIGAGGLEAIVHAVVTAPASTAALASTATLALQLACAAATEGLALAAPIVLAALVGNLGVAIAHRAAAAVNVFAVGLVVSLLMGGLALLATSAQLTARMQRLADQAVHVLAAEAP